MDQLRTETAKASAHAAHVQAHTQQTPPLVTWNLGLWNVRSLKPDDTVISINECMRRLGLDVLYLTETHISEVKEQQGKDSSFFNSGVKLGSRELQGVGFLVNNKHLVGDYTFTGYSDRVARLSIPTDKSPLNFVVCYAPTESNGTDEEMNDFYRDLEKAISDKQGDHLIIGGDFNCRIGRDEEPLRKVVGRWTGQVITSDHGERLIDFCHQRNLRICNTFFNNTLLKRTTWTHPQTKRRETLDFFIASEDTFKRFLVVKGRPAEDCGSDHDLLEARAVIQDKPKRIRRLAIPKRKARLNPFVIKEHMAPFQDCVRVNINTLERDGNRGWKHTEEAIQKSLKEVLPRKQRKSPDWFVRAESTCVPLLKARTGAKKAMHQNNTDATRSAFRDAKKNFRKHVKKCKSDNLLRIGEEIEASQEKHDSHQVKLLMQELLKESAAKGDSRLGQRKPLISDADLRDHYQAVFNKQSPVDRLADLVNLPADMSLDEPPTAAEVQIAVEGLSNNKAPGTNNIPAEAFKCGGQRLIERLAQDFKDIWPLPGEEATLPQEWQEAQVFTLYKGKGPRSDPNSYRGIFLLDVAGKILAKVVSNRLKLLTEKVLPDTQFGFRESRSCMQAIFVVRQVQQAARYKKQNLVAAAVDLEKAFDSIPRNAIWQCLTAIGTPPRLVEIVKGFHKNSKGFINHEEFAMTRGVRQGCILGPILFNIFFHFLIKQAGLSQGILLNTVSKCDIPIKLAPSKRIELIDVEYADDQFIFGSSKMDLEANLQRLDAVSSPMGVNVSTSKTKIIWLSEGTITDEEAAKQVTIKGQVLQETTSFCYLGQTISPEGSIDVEVASRIRSAKGKLSAIGPVLQSSRISEKSKVAIIKQVVFPALLYGSETWNTTATDENRIAAFLNLCRLKVIGKTRFDHLTTQHLEARISFPKVRTLLAKRRLNFYSSLMSETAPILARDMISVEVLQGKKVGGRKIQAWTARLSGDADWMKTDQLDREEFLRKLVLIGRTAETALSRKRQVAELMAKEEPDALAPRLVQVRVKLIQCEDAECHHMFAEEREMRRHMRLCHRDQAGSDPEEDPDPERPFRCQLCCMAYKTIGWYNRHMASSHPQIIAQNVASPPAPPPPPPPHTQTNAHLDVVQPVIIPQSFMPQHTQPTNPPITIGPQATPQPQIPPQDQSELIVPPGPPYHCPFRGCHYICGSQKAILHHGASKHGWNLTSCKPSQKRETKEQAAARGAGGGT